MENYPAPVSAPKSKKSSKRSKKMKKVITVEDTGIWTPEEVNWPNSNFLGCTIWTASHGQEGQNLQKTKQILPSKVQISNSIAKNGRSSQK